MLRGKECEEEISAVFASFRSLWGLLLAVGRSAVFASFFYVRERAVTVRLISINKFCVAAPSDK